MIVVRVISVDVDTTPEDVKCAAFLATWQAFLATWQAFLATWQAFLPETALPVFDFCDGQWHPDLT